MSRRDSNMRLFIAIDPGDEIKDALCGVMEELRKGGAGGRFSRRENLHMTLAFIGETEPERLCDVKAAMENVRFEPFLLKMTSPGRFRRDGGDILWYGADGGDALARLQRSLILELKRRGFSPDEKAFRPHFTIAREAKNAPLIPESAKCLCRKIDSMGLMKSERTGGRLVYTRVFSKKAD